MKLSTWKFEFLWCLCAPGIKDVKKPFTSPLAKNCLPNVCERESSCCYVCIRKCGRSDIYRKEMRNFHLLCFTLFHIFWGFLWDLCLWFFHFVFSFPQVIVGLHAVVLKEISYGARNGIRPRFLDNQSHFFTQDKVFFLASLQGWCVAPKGMWAMPFTSVANSSRQLGW